MLHLLSVILVFFALLALLVLTHELGHFLTARWLGIKVEEFGFGLPPRLLGLVKIKTKKGRKRWKWVSQKKIEEKKDSFVSPVYSLNAIPFGGFVKILGEDGGSKNNPQSFSFQPVSKRFLVLIAGIFMNFLLGMFLFTFGFWSGFPEIANDEDAVKNPKVQIVQIEPGSPAAEAGLKIGDTIKSLVLPNKEKVNIEKVKELQDLIKEWAGSDITIEILRGNDLYRMHIVPRQNPPAGQGAIGIELARIGIAKYSLVDSLKLGPEKSVQLFLLIADYLRNTVAKLIQAEKVQVDLSGPVGIVVLTNQMKEMGLPYLIQFAAIISINLAFINLLPFPALDGGRILFLVIEKIKGCPVSQKLESVIHSLGLYFLLGLMVLITVKDISRFREKFEMLFERLGIR